jgi:hypothetical protein
VIVEWEIDHRKNSPIPIRTNGANIHLTTATDADAEVRSYIFVTQIVNGAVCVFSTAIVGSVRHEDGQLRRADLRELLDTAASQVSSLTRRNHPA